MNKEQFKKDFLNFLFQNTQYSYLMGSQELVSSNSIEVELIIPSSCELEDIFLFIMYFIEIEVLEKVKKTESDVNMPLIKHPNIKYVTSDKDFYQLDKDFTNLNPFLNENLVYFNVSKPISDLENHINDIQINGNKVRWKIPIYH